MQLNILKQLTPDLTAKQNQKISQNISKQERKKGNCSARKVRFNDGSDWLDVRWEWCSPYRNVRFVGVLFLPWRSEFALNVWTLQNAIKLCILLTVTSMVTCCYSNALHNDVPVDDRPCIQQWSHKIIILWYNIIILTIVLQLPTVFSTVTCCTGL